MALPSDGAESLKPSTGPGGEPAWEVVDSHAHLDSGRFQRDLDQVLERARAARVTRIITIGADIGSSRRAVALAAPDRGIFAAVGIHPHDARSCDERALDELRRLARRPGVVAVGEIGLDYYRDLSPRPEQRQALREQLRLAVELKLPVVIHDRQAHQDVMDILDGELGAPPPVTVVMHCFSGGPELARTCLERGYYISLAGPVTYAGATAPREVARIVPAGRLLVETDCPYLTPEPNRKGRNEPALVVEVARCIAGARGVDLAAVAASTTAAARAAFNLP